MPGAHPCALGTFSYLVTSNRTRYEKALFVHVKSLKKEGEPPPLPKLWRRDAADVQYHLATLCRIQRPQAMIVQCAPDRVVQSAFVELCLRLVLVRANVLIGIEHTIHLSGATVADRAFALLTAPGFGAATGRALGAGLQGTSGTAAAAAAAPGRLG